MSIKSFNPIAAIKFGDFTATGLNLTRTKSHDPIITKNAVIARDSEVCVLGLYHNYQGHNHDDYR